MSYFVMISYEIKICYWSIIYILGRAGSGGGPVPALAGTGGGTPRLTGNGGGVPVFIDVPMSKS